MNEAPEQPHRVGFVGLGMMGHPMARRLRDAGYPLVVLDRDRGIAEDFVAEHGGVIAGTLRELAQRSDVCILMLPDGHVVREVVVGGADRLVDGAAPGSSIVDMSSSDPSGTRDLGTLLENRGLHLMDAPVSGGVPRALAGKLSILAGGSVDDLARCRPLLEQLGNQIFHTGPLGSGHAMKALNNLLSATGLLAAAEVLQMGTRFGLDPELMLEVLNASTGRNNSTENKFGPYVLSGTYDSGFALTHMVKDLRIALNLAHDTDTFSPLSEEALARCEEAAHGLDPGADHTAVARWMQDMAGSRYDGRGQP